MRKIMLIFGMLVILPFLLMGCGNQGIDLDDIDIDAIDRFDVPAGTYVIQYSIEDISDLVKNHGAVVSFTVTNSDQEVITVSGNSFTVEANEVYTVVIKLTIGDVYKEKTITVTAVTLSSDVLVTFNLNGGSGSFPALTVARNSVLSALGTPTKDGYTFGGWFVDEALTTAYTNQEVANNLTLYAKWNEIVIATATVTSFTLDLTGLSGSLSSTSNGSTTSKLTSAPPSLLSAESISAPTAQHPSGISLGITETTPWLICFLGTRPSIRTFWLLM